MATSAVELRGVNKWFAGDVHAVKDLSLTIEDGELLVLVGPSGCGKSTVLRMIAGLEDVTAGEILIGGDVVNARSPQERNVAMVFQNYALYPHKTVRQNLEFPLRMMGRPAGERRRRVREVADLLGLADFMDKRPRALSGGQRQRVAMGRAMVREPAVFLLDEPLSNLDAKLRVQIRAEIAALQQRMNTTTVYVTHDQVEAMTLGHRVAVLQGGRLQQVATGQELYDRPANAFVAGFIGSPAMNIFAAELQQTEGGLIVPFGDRQLPVPKEMADACDLARFVGRKVLVGLRPEAFSLDGGASGDVAYTAKVKSVEALGHENIVYLESPIELCRDVETESSNESAATRQTLAARLPAHGALPGQDEHLTLAIDCGRLCLFDGEGKALAPTPPKTRSDVVRNGGRS